MHACDANTHPVVSDEMSDNQGMQSRTTTDVGGLLAPTDEHGHRRIHPAAQRRWNSRSTIRVGCLGVKESLQPCPERRPDRRRASWAADATTSPFRE